MDKSTEAAYQRAKQRCNNPKHARFARYGGRGIEFRFASIADFVAEVGFKPSLEYSLDRINNDGHYEPGNVRWATQKDQQRNRSNNHLLTHDGITLSVAEWAERLGISYGGMSGRVRARWCVPCSVSLGLCKRCPHVDRVPRNVTKGEQ